MAFGFPQTASGTDGSESGDRGVTPVLILF